MNENINAFIEKLSLYKESNDVEILYRNNDSRRINVELYLNKMFELKPTILLIGEAPGYKGCGISGIPFTSEQIIFENDFFNKSSFPYHLRNIKRLNSENTAKIMWEVISFWKEKPLLWNIFPHHPHKIENVQSNRCPNKKELIYGKSILNELLKIFQNINKIYAIGRQAESQIYGMEKYKDYLRHPSYGGKVDFVNGMKKLNL